MKEMCNATAGQNKRNSKLFSAQQVWLGSGPLNFKQADIKFIGAAERLLH